MRRSLRCKLFAGLALSGLVAASQAQVLDSRWRLRVMDLEHRVQAEATIRFTSEEAGESCMGGQWKRVVVESKTSGGKGFFPLGEPLAYELERGFLTLGRTAVCDGYLFLNGKAGKTAVEGTYDALGIGYNRKLGYFSLSKIR